MGLIKLVVGLVLFVVTLKIVLMGLGLGLIYYAHVISLP